MHPFSTTDRYMLRTVSEFFLCRGPEHSIEKDTQQQHNLDTLNIQGTRRRGLWGRSQQHTHTNSRERNFALLRAFNSEIVSKKENIRKTYLEKFICFKLKLRSTYECNTEKFPFRRKYHVWWGWNSADVIAWTWNTFWGIFWKLNLNCTTISSMIKRNVKFLLAHGNLERFQRAGRRL